MLRIKDKVNFKVSKMDVKKAKIKMLKSRTTLLHQDVTLGKNCHVKLLWVF